MGVETDEKRTDQREVARACQGMAGFVAARFPAADRRIAIGYDGLPRSEARARTAAEVFAANGVQAFLFDRPMPAPTLSYAARVLQCAAGVMLTDADAPAEGSGCRFYGPDGSRVGAEAAATQAGADGPDPLDDPWRMTFDGALSRGRIAWIPDWVATSFVKEVKRQSPLFGAPVDKTFSIAYAPRNGSGREMVPRALAEGGYGNVIVLPDADGQETMRHVLERAGRTDADLLLATDADCGRCALAVKGPEGFRPMTGDEAGLLLLDFVCRRRQDLGLMPADPVLVLAGDVPDAAERVAAGCGARAVRVARGFEHIGEVVARLEAEGRPESFLFGLEAGGGCLTGRYARERDGVGAALLLCDMFAWHRSRGVDLFGRLDALRA